MREKYREKFQRGALTPDQSQLLRSVVLDVASEELSHRFRPYFFSIFNNARQFANFSFDIKVNR